MTHPTRRRVLTIAAALAALPRTALAAAPVHRWRGTALGAEASLTLVGVDGPRAEALARGVEAEIARLEDIFSLYRPGSALSRLNRDGHLAAPPAELVALLSLCGALNGATGGAFDPTVQPLWAAHAGAAAEGRTATAAEIAAARALTGWAGVGIDPARIALARPGMALTLNGIAQGAIADRVADLLAAQGLTDVLVDMGEIVGLGHRPDGTPWQAGIIDPEGALMGRAGLSGRALATSAPMGTVLDPAGRVGHIFDPRTGAAAAGWRVVSVSAPRAALADGLSTAFALMARPAIDAALGASPGAALELLV
ncbi:MAG: FAD:protein FMN transferase [Thermohalobaculum sp.]|nr:FAD:protein FMN transferase [Thermohalobaculum sp.]